MVRGDQSVASSSYSSQVEKALKRIEVGVIGLSSIPRELCIGDKLDLSRWSLILNDDNLEFISSQKAIRNEFHFINASESDLSKMFATFWDPRNAPLGLTSLKVAGAKNISDFGVSKVARSCTNLKELDISSCPGLGDVTLRELGLNCRNLEKLSISNCNNIEGTGLTAVSECCPNLMKLNISRCKNLQRWAISKVFYDCKKLEEVDVSYMQVISDEEIRVLAQNNSRLLTVIAIDSCSISDTGILALSQHCPDLDKLDLTRREMTYKITDVGMLALGQRSKSLRILKLNGCEVSIAVCSK